jgi:ubiquitin-protein ligase
MSCDNIAPQVITRILREVRDLSRKPADGITYVDNTENSIAEVHAIITGPGELCMHSVDCYSDE